MKAKTGSRRGCASARQRDDVVMELEELMPVISKAMDDVYFRNMLKLTLLGIMARDSSTREMAETVLAKFVACVRSDFWDIVGSQEFKQDPGGTTYWKQLLQDSEWNRGRACQTSAPCQGTPLDYFSE
ncbi:MAG TPA: hypothetical protein PLY87_08980 [Planctomycetaceae bacterium]|nr:hypothetical protein [Planctomycetaceae bacterium]